MSNTKTYILAYNRVSQKIIHYATKEQAEQQQVQYHEVEASDLKEAKETYREHYLYNHTEGHE